MSRMMSMALTCAFLVLPACKARNGSSAAAKELDGIDCTVEACDAAQYGASLRSLVASISTLVDKIGAEEHIVWNDKEASKGADGMALAEDNKAKLERLQQEMTALQDKIAKENADSLHKELTNQLHKLATLLGKAPSPDEALKLKGEMDSLTSRLAQLTAGDCAEPGKNINGVCWYLGAEGRTCDEACEEVGKVYSPKTGTVAGFEGTDAACLQVAAAFGKGYLARSAQNPLTNYANSENMGCFSCSQNCNIGLAEDTAMRAGKETVAWIGSPGHQRFCACDPRIAASK